MIVVFNKKLSVFFWLTKFKLACQERSLGISMLGYSKDSVTPFLKFFPDFLDLINRFEKGQEIIVI